MPRKPKDPDEPLPMTTAEWDIEDFMEEWAPQTAIVEIFRVKDDGSKPNLRRVSIGILKADLYGYLRQQFGGGKYWLQFKNDQRRIVKQLTVDVEAGLTSPTGAPLPQSNTFQEQLLLAMVANMRPAPAVDVGALLQGLGGMIAGLKPNSSDPAAMLTAMAATFQQLRPSEDGVEKALSIISKAKDIGGGGGEAREENFYTMLKDVGKVFADKLLPGGGAPGGKPNGVGMLPSHVQIVPPLPVNAVPPTVAETPESEDMRLEKWLRAQLAFLKQKANAGKDPEFWAEYILDNEEEPGNRAILVALDRGATLEHLLQFDPEIGQNPVLRDWFEKLYASIMQPDPDKTMDTPGPGGDGANAPGNAKPSPKG